ncbi:MAG: hypothetical protein IJ375_04810 [Oscillospiraceae bacterium]|nr:hypothetical protein [Oscillospiraceae bacterium]
MNAAVYEKIHTLESTPEALEETVRYIAGKLRVFLHASEQVLICYPNSGPASFGGMLERAVLACDCTPVFWGPDYRWKTLLRQAFSMHAITIFGPPLVVLGLMKMAKATATPLYAHNVLLGGYPYASWMVEGIKKGLDCRIWGCYSVGPGPIVAGFTCSREAGIHLRDDLFEVSIRDDDGKLLPDPQRGHLILTYKKDPTLVYDTEESAKLLHQPCSCGNDAPRILDTLYVGEDDPTKKILEERFLAWSSILDYKVEKTESGIALELVVFPGEALPQIPNCAKLDVRPWDPERDIPFCMEGLQKLAEKDWQNC